MPARHWLGALLLVLQPLAHAAIQVTDDLGNSVTLARPAGRVVALTPHATELVAALAPGALVGTDSASNYPAGVANLPRVGRYDAVNVEAIIALKPDLVVAWEGTAVQRSLQAVQKLGIPVFFSTPQTPVDVASNLTRLGVLLGKPQRAAAQARAMQRDYAALKARFSHAQPVRVFLQISPQPLLSISERAFLGRAINDCGGINAFADASEQVPQVSMEAVLAFAPQVMVATSPVTELAMWRRYQALPAVASGQLYGIVDDRLMRPGPRLVEGVTLLCERIDAARRALAQPKRAK
ncbi:Vitamin B12-binding protein [Andreprevotia sp. IGB-42]|uniref:helical backbone metal receptor n=1 Tax=Andreprevotia sp. IGB-42 TaxID=2497473 RepID=UPI001358B896|nr:helical backbone metal receptor [Andreprevotia sp. IGB-42]KAF0812446.1 Vitamin B12-binding protein [Andreprevotia sp. IGB-42]